MAYLYMLTAPNGNSYIGITSKPVHDRWTSHNYAAKKNAKYPLYAAIRKYGWENIKKVVLVVGSFDYVKMMEVKAIKAFNTFAPFGYNLTLGGDGIKGFKVQEKTKEKMSALQKGEKGFWFGKKLSPETKAKMSASGKGRKHSDASKKQMSLGQKKAWVTPGRKEKVSSSLKAVKYVCPHCDLTGGMGMFKWHFDNCRNKVEHS